MSECVSDLCANVQYSSKLSGWREEFPGRPDACHFTVMGLRDKEQMKSMEGVMQGSVHTVRSISWAAGPPRLRAKHMAVFRLSPFSHTRSRGWRVRGGGSRGERWGWEGEVVGLPLTCRF
jgi:hypothetical protein